jgi:hypothetical protein
MGRIIIVLCLILSLGIGCAPKEFTPYQPPEIKFDPTPKYELDLTPIQALKPDKIKPIYVDENFQQVEKEDAKFVVLAPSEYAKIAAILKIAKAYKDVAKEQEVLINTNINIINSLKEFVALEQAKTKAALELYGYSENAYRQERYERKVDNAINKMSFGAIAAGILIAIIAM